MVVRLAVEGPEDRLTALSQSQSGDWLTKSTNFRLALPVGYMLCDLGSQSGS